MIGKMGPKDPQTPLYGVVDERTRAIVCQGDAYAGRFMLYAVLFDVFIRGLKLNDPLTASNWDLMLIVILGGFISTAYQIRHKVLFNGPRPRSVAFIIWIIALSALIAFMAARLANA